MREIKFRLWCENKKEWETDTWVLWSNGLIYDIKLKKSMNRKTHILEEYTGLHDKNGKEIYEGDICTFYDGEIVEVLFEKGKFILNGKEISLMWNPNFAEVIGNIHQNPELLK